jgi:DnaJ-class molecular chaperone
MRRDYYAVLGISATAGPREVRRAYQRLARQYSPDVNWWDERAGGLFAEIREAYRILSDPRAREHYDQFGASFLGDALGPGRRGEDLHATVELSFAEAAAGARPTVTVTRFSDCRACGATGNAAGQRCTLCQGRGVRRATERITVSVPAGVDSGTQLRVPEEGHAGPFGGPRGDLLVSTRVREHPFFVRKGDSVHCEVPISVWEALRGARITLPTPTGESVVVIPPGTASGQVLRLRGQGLPRLTGEGPGDLHVTVRVEMPRGIDPRTDELVRDLERLIPMTPRQDLAQYRGGGQ